MIRDICAKEHYITLKRKYLTICHNKLSELKLWYAIKEYFIISLNLHLFYRYSSPK